MIHTQVIKHNTVVFSNVDPFPKSEDFQVLLAKYLIVEFKHFNQTL